MLTGGAWSAFAALTAFGHLQVFHQLVELFHQLHRFGHAAFFHQLLNAVHEGLQFVLCDGFPVLLLVGLVGAVVVRWFHLVGEHLHVVVHRLAQFLHQFSDFFIRCAVAHRFLKAFLRPFQTRPRIGQRPFFELHSKFPERQRKFIPHIVAQPDVGHVFQTADNKAQAQIGRFIRKKIIGSVGYGAQNLRGPWGVCLGPQNIAPLFDHGPRNGLEKPPPRQCNRFRYACARLAQGIFDVERERHRQVRPWVFTEIINQHFFEIGAVTGKWHRQVKNNVFARIGINHEAVATVHRSQVQLQSRRTGHHPVIIARGKGLGHLALCVRFDRAGQFNNRWFVFDQQDLPACATLALNRDRAGLRDLEPLLLIRCRAQIIGAP